MLLQQNKTSEKPESISEIVEVWIVEEISLTP